VQLVGVWAIVAGTFLLSLIVGRTLARSIALRAWLALACALGFLVGVTASILLGGSAGASFVVGFVTALAFIPGYTLMWKGFRRGTT
jgi:hypothetical protein